MAAKTNQDYICHSPYSLLNLFFDSRGFCEEIAWNTANYEHSRITLGLRYRCLAVSWHLKNKCYALSRSTSHFQVTFICTHAEKCGPNKAALILKKNRKAYYTKMTFNGITLTWATHVDPAELGARMESYVEVKAPIHVFRLCVQRAPSEAPLGRLSPELVEMIATEVYDAAFNKHLKAWQQFISCCEETCRRSEHLSEESCELSRDEFQMELESHPAGNSRCIASYCACRYNFDDWLVHKGIGHDEHTLPMEDFLEKVMNNSYVEGSGSFAKCRKVCSFLLGSFLGTKQLA